MRPLILFLLLILFASCRSQKTVQHEASEMSHTHLNAQLEQFSASQITSLLSTSSDIDLSGITIEFYHSDSLHPDIRAMPKSLSIETAHINAISNAAEHKTTEDAGKETVNLLADTSTSLKHESESDIKSFSPPAWILTLSIFIVVTAIIYSIKRKLQ